jgi:hypothetical protein
MQNQLIKQGKKAVYSQDHQALKDLYRDAQRDDYEINMTDIFLKLFYYACRYNRRSTIIFLFQMYYEIFSQTERIALRQSFYYGKFKITDKDILKWYSDNIIPMIRKF